MRDYNYESEDEKLKVLLGVLAKESEKGFRFDTVAIRQLSERTGIDIDYDTRDALRRMIFRRSDGACFLIDSVADANLRNAMIGKADEWLKEYGFFELEELRKLFSDQLNEMAVREPEDFKAFYEILKTHAVHCVTFKGLKIVHLKEKSRDDVLSDLSKKIIEATRNEFGGFIDEKTLKSRFPAVSVELISNVVTNRSDELIKTETSNNAYYRTFDAPVLSEEFPEMLKDTLDQLDRLEIEPSESVLNTALSLRLGVNFKQEYGVTHQATFKRVISDNYKGHPMRRWKSGLFLKTTNQ
jgi:hypothetical protein